MGRKRKENKMGEMFSVLFDETSFKENPVNM